MARVGVAAALWLAQGAAAQNALDQDLYNTGQAGGARPSTYAGGARPNNAAGGSAYGQFSNVNPMGDGRALDRNLSLTTTYNANRRNDPLQEMRFRSAVVTGNAPGGLSFRGDLGYDAARSFRGDLGSNDLYAFRRDSLFSGLVGAGIRGTDALQYQMSMTTGAMLPPNLVGDLVVDPAFSTRAPLRSARGEGRAAAPGDETPISRAPRVYDEDGSMHSMLRSTSAYTTTMSLQPTLLNRYAAGGEGQADLGMTASTLRGIRLSSLPEGDESLAAQLRANDSALPSQRVEGSGRVETGYDAVVRQFEEAEEALRLEREARSGQSTVEPEKTWVERINELRDRVNRGEPKPIPGTGQDPAEPADPNAAEDEDLERLMELGIYDEETIELLRRAREPVEKLVDPDVAASRDPYAEHMEVGQRLLAQERFFDAEERFTRAIGVRSGDVMAQVGRVHAQIGAGMYLSGALNLRVLYIQHPELVGVKYDERLLPGKARQKVVFVSLRKKVGIGEDGGEVATPDPHLKRESGLLLAYMGYQLGDTNAVEQGLGAFEAVTESFADDETQAVDRRLLELLQRVWAVDDKPAP